MEASLRLTDRGGKRYGYVGRGQRNGAVSRWSSFLFSYGGDVSAAGRSAISSTRRARPGPPT
ncbi:hypothetical protein [Streptomyces sp. DASNCL29]|uniref:hypothetical protein n=1 Tax=Streptomyces sp. DASNCL29 TaxID=2583819 RepID=UPI001F0FA39E|nr:hypothetical protein [Streptomyces sp. DASNCL29]